MTKLQTEIKALETVAKDLAAEYHRTDQAHVRFVQSLEPLAKQAVRPSYNLITGLTAVLRGVLQVTADLHDTIEIFTRAVPGMVAALKDRQDAAGRATFDEVVEAINGDTGDTGKKAATSKPASKARKGRKSEEKPN